MAIEQPRKEDLKRIANQSHFELSDAEADAIGAMLSPIIAFLDRVDQTPACQPDLVAGADLGGDGGEADRQRLDWRVAEFLLQLLKSPQHRSQPFGPGWLHHLQLVIEVLHFFTPIMKLFFLIAAGSPRHPVSRLTIGVVKARSDRLPFFRQDEHVLKVIRCFHQGPNNLMQRRFTSLPELTGRRTLLGDPRSR